MDKGKSASFQNRIVTTLAELDDIHGSDVVHERNRYYYHIQSYGKQLARQAEGYTLDGLECLLNKASAWMARVRLRRAGYG